MKSNSRETKQEKESSSKSSGIKPVKEVSHLDVAGSKQVDDQLSPRQLIDIKYLGRKGFSSKKLDIALQSFQEFPEDLADVTLLQSCLTHDPRFTKTFGFAQSACRQRNRKIQYYLLRFCREVICVYLKISSTIATSEKLSWLGTISLAAAKKLQKMSNVSAAERSFLILVVATAILAEWKLDGLDLDSLQRVTIQFRRQLVKSQPGSRKPLDSTGIQVLHLLPSLKQSLTIEHWILVSTLFETTANDYTKIEAKHSDVVEQLEQSQERVNHLHSVVDELKETLADHRREITSKESDIQGLRREINETKEAANFDILQLTEKNQAFLEECNSYLKGAYEACDISPPEISVIRKRLLLVRKNLEGQK